MQDMLQVYLHVCTCIAYMSAVCLHVFTICNTHTGYNNVAIVFTHAYWHCIYVCDTRLQYRYNVCTCKHCINLLLLFNYFKTAYLIVATHTDSLQDILLISLHCNICILYIIHHNMNEQLTTLSSDDSRVIWDFSSSFSVNS